MRGYGEKAVMVIATVAVIYLLLNLAFLTVVSLPTIAGSNFAAGVVVDRMFGSAGQNLLRGLDNLLIPLGAYGFLRLYLDAKALRSLLTQAAGGADVRAMASGQPTTVTPAARPPSDRRSHRRAPG